MVLLCQVSCQVYFFKAQNYCISVCLPCCKCKHLCAGKTSTAVTLAKHYGAACLSVDEVVQEALSSGNSFAALRARELCARAAVVYAQKEVEETDMMATSGQGAGVLSVEAVAKHTAEGSQTSDPKVPPSSASTRNKTNVTGHSQKNGSSGPAASVVHAFLGLFKNSLFSQYFGLVGQ